MAMVEETEEVIGIGVVVAEVVDIHEVEVVDPIMIVALTVEEGAEVEEEEEGEEEGKSSVR